MDVTGAIDATLALAVRERMPAEGAFSYDHLLDMRRRIAASSPPMSYGKLCRWLAWMQAALYHSGIADLDALKELSRRFAGPAAPSVAVFAGDGLFRKTAAIREQLARRGLGVVLVDTAAPDPLGEEGQAAWRRGLAVRVMDAMKDEATVALLLVFRGAIDAMAFAAAAAAFAAGKPIYLMDDVPAWMFREEMDVFGAVPLRGDLSKLIESLAAPA